jgi:outer membrane protein TolC
MLRFFTVCFFLLLGVAAGAQARMDSVLHDATLAGCVQYALVHQPVVQQSLLDEDITERQIQQKLADWYPQLGLNYNLQHNFELPASYFLGAYIRSGANNSSNLGVGLTQNIFNKDVLFASRTAGDVRQQAKQNTGSNKIDITVSVSKAFYDVLLTQQQVAVLKEDIIRLERSLKDAISQYQSGVADKTDYKRATISLNNAKAQLKQSTVIIAAKTAYLKQLMGLPDAMPLKLQYDTANIEKDAVMDTAQLVHYDNRIEYKLLQTQQRLQGATLKYYKNAYLPTLSAFGNYNLGYLNNDFLKTYNQTFSNSYIGLTLSMPIFQGNKRVLQVRQAELQSKRLDWDMVALKSKVNAQYEAALSVYKGNWYNYIALKENVVLAEEVYKTLDLQYKSGIKTYLDVIIAESDLRTAQLNFYDALFQLVQSKFDVQKALGTIQY